MTVFYFIVQKGFNQFVGCYRNMEYAEALRTLSEDYKGYERIIHEWSS